MEIQLQSILMPSEGICNVSELYYHRNGKQVAFDGYFNLFYVEKRKAYTAIEKLFLTLRLKGFSSLTLYHDREKLGEVLLEAGKEKEYKVFFPYGEYKDGVFWFALDEEEAGKPEVSGMYAAEIAESLVRPVNIGIDICTYRREPYVIRNLTQINRQLLEKKELDVSSHIRVYVVDNGKTLEGCDEIREICSRSEGKIRIFPNKNAGGAGGFTRGMMEILEEKDRYGMTHVLIMDDDAVVEPDTLVRLYGVLSTLRPEWQEAAVGGALMREDYPHILFCAGEVWKNGKITNPRKNLDVRNFDLASCGYLTETGNEHSWYSGWWCCCYPLSTVRKDNLPLPMFIHIDDIEYCLRNQGKGLLFFNGIGVWHKGFELAFESRTLYYDIRNALMAIALYGTGNKKKTALKFVMKSITVAAIRMRYEDATAVYQGFLDFLKGPKWLWRQDPEKLNDKARTLSSKYIPVEKIMEEMPEKEARELKRQLDAFWDVFSEDMVLNGPKDGKKGSLLHYLTFNGFLLPGDQTLVKLITPMDSPWEAFRKKKVVWYEPGSGKALLARRDYRKLKRIAGLCVKSLILYQRYMDRALAAYRDGARSVVSYSKWKKYLQE